MGYIRFNINGHEILLNPNANRFFALSELGHYSSDQLCNGLDGYVSYDDRRKVDEYTDYQHIQNLTDFKWMSSMDCPVDGYVTHDESTDLFYISDGTDCDSDKFSYKYGDNVGRRC